MSESGITGTTRIIGLIGNPISSARSPLLVNALLQQRGLFGALVFVPFAFAPAGLASWVGSLRQLDNFAGALVTMPFKQAILPLLDQVSAAARIAGAVNAVRRLDNGRLEGDILDGLGFVRGLQASGYAIAQQRFLVYGCGGAASAIVCALAQEGAARIDIQNRTFAHAVELVRRVQAEWPLVALQPSMSASASYDVVINATSLGMQDSDPLPIQLDVIQKTRLVADIVITRDMTPLLLLAQSHGIAIQRGLPMLTGQLDLFLEFVGATP